MILRRIIFYGLTGLLLLTLIGHISIYYFTTDDAFISFRYAVNLADGHGLVFNIGERVEGYTNFLWVIILSLLSLVGIAPDKMANILSILASVTLFFSVIWFNRKYFAEYKYDLVILIAPLLLALNRTYAVWSTGGLETKLFSLLVFLGVVFLIKSWFDGENLFFRSALLFALASLTRPEGILITGSFFGYYLLLNIRQREKLKLVVKPLLLYAVIVGAHFIFRFIYYGYLFPNTFYAKVEGVWFAAGFTYLFLFIHEYGLYFLLLPVLFIISRSYDRTRRQILLVTILPFIPYFLYLASIGGDHFEFRPLDVILPFLAIRIQEGFRQMRRWLTVRIKTAASFLVVAYAAWCLVFYVLPGYLSHRNFPSIYDSGVAVRTADSDNPLVKFIPGMNNYLTVFDTAHRKLATNFVCIRQEEHKLAMEQYFRPQAELMVEAIQREVIRDDEIICLWCIGAIPYYSKLKTIDYLGLTDEYIAHRRFPEQHLKESGQMGHNRRADWNYLVRRRVTYLSIKPSQFFFPIQDYFDGRGIKDGRLTLKTYLVPFGNYAFVFRSAYQPAYFQERYSRIGIDFFYRQMDGQTVYFPGS